MQPVSTVSECITRSSRGSENTDPEDWGWKKHGNILMPIQISKPPAPPDLMKLIFCRCKGNCGSMCGCRKAGLKCSVVCLNCSGETCSNVMEMSKLMEEHEFEDELPTMTPISTSVIPRNFIFDTEIDPEPQPGPSKKIRKE